MSQFPLENNENNDQENLPVDEMLQYMYNFRLNGHVIDHTWYKFIRWQFTKKKPEGKPHPSAISLLSDVCYWYRPTVEKDESGNVTLNKKFRSDILQRSYVQIEDSLGFTKAEARSGFDTLKRLGICKLVFRTITRGGIKISNVMFINFNPIRLKELIDDELKKSIPLSFQNDEVVGLKLPPYPFKTMTNTETSSETSQIKNNNRKEHRVAPKKFSIKGNPSDSVVVSHLKKLKLSKAFAVDLAKKLNPEKAKLLVQRVLRWKTRENDDNDERACNTILKGWDSWGDELTQEEKKSEEDKKHSALIEKGEERKQRAEEILKGNHFPDISIKTDHIYVLEVKKKKFGPDEERSSSYYFSQDGCDIFLDRLEKKQQQLLEKTG